jgi:hypothetical protein
MRLADYQVKPLTKRATEVIRFLSERVIKHFLLLGWRHSADDAIEKLQAGYEFNSIVYWFYL